MINLSKKFALMLSFIVVFSVLLVEPCVAPVTVPANPKKGPEIASVTINNDPVWSPPLIVTDPFTGEVTYSVPGYWVQNGVIELTIKNQPFTPYTDENGNLINRYYCIFIKDTKKPPLSTTKPNRTVYQSNSDYTVITFTYNGVEIALPDIYVPWENAVLDFRVQAVTGHFNVGTHPRYFDAVYEGEGSAFTEFAITLPDVQHPGVSKPNSKPTSVVPSASSPSPSNISDQPSQTPWITNLRIIIVTVGIIIIPLAIIAYQYGRRKTIQDPYSENAPTGNDVLAGATVKGVDFYWIAVI